MLASMVLPCYNPQAGWEHIIYDNYTSFLSRAAITPELILVLDGVSATVREEHLNFLREKIPALKVVTYPVNRGKGYAIRQGVKAAIGEIIIYTDADFPYTEASLLAVFNALKEDQCDVAAGVKNDAYYTHVPFLRHAISRGLRFFIRIFLSTPITDTQCGLKGFRQQVKPLFLQTTIDRYLFDLEFIRNGFRSKSYRIQAIPVGLKENIHFRKMNYRILFSESVNFIKLLLSK